jgi:hypothetical protein
VVSVVRIADPDAPAFDILERPSRCRPDVASGCSSGNPAAQEVASRPDATTMTMPKSRPGVCGEMDDVAVGPLGRYPDTIAASVGYSLASP